MARAILTRDESTHLYTFSLDFDSIAEGLDKIGNSPTLFGHHVRSLEVHQPMDEFVRFTVECIDSKTGERFSYSGIFRD